LAQAEIQLDVLSRLSKLTESDSKTTNGLNAIKSDMVIIDKRTYLTDLIDFKKNSAELLKTRDQFISYQRKQVENKISFLNSKQLSTQIPNSTAKENHYVVDKAAEKGKVTGGVIGAVLSICFIALDITYSDVLDIFFTLVFSPIFIVPAIMIGAGLGWLAGFIYGKANDAARVQQEQAEHDAAKKQALAELEKEKRSVSQSRAEASKLERELGMLVERLGHSANQN